jgi:hypothetical protein
MAFMDDGKTTAWKGVLAHHTKAMIPGIDYALR